MTRPSPLLSAPSRSPRPSGDVVLHALANRYLGMPTRPRATIGGRSTASGRLWRLSTGRGVASASVRSSCPPCSPVPGSPACHAELGMFAEGRALGEEGLRIAEAVDHPGKPHGCLLGDRSAVPPPRRSAQGTPPARTGHGHLSGRGPPVLFPLDGCGLGGSVHSGRARCRGRAAAHAGDGTDHCNGKGRSSGALSSLPGGGASAGRPPGGGAHPRRGALALAREHQERGHQAYALRLLGDIAARREPPESESGRSLTTTRPSPWPTNSACARCWRTVISGSGPCMPRSDAATRPALHWPRPSRSTAPWTCPSGCPRPRRSWHRWRARGWTMRPSVHRSWRYSNRSSASRIAS